jgi:hypothetical protein
MKILVFMAALAMMLPYPMMGADPHEAVGTKDTHTEDAHAEHAGLKDEHAQEADAHAEGEAAHKPNSSTGPGLAVEDFEPGRKSIKLSPKAVQRMEIVSQTLPKQKQGLRVQTQALVLEKGLPYVFVYENGWFTRTPVKILVAAEGQKLIVSGIHADDPVVVQGSGLLRLTELDLMAGAHTGHGH